ncbi:PLP-dependent aminotransferase family protein [Streptomyces sp. WMMC500]|uniref:aminotransferase-like domain-containing protein n=1 Tax=Streptomyces sp. WMMC500 TaxID=3015154 RepID=UPI00248CEEE0|nr:PLP-dependent aminotransferase family protein [Streptomyces sp. WMMC500]WBB58000.1 PLP-dependent aminotransferase family protein [Streptomyces sp. WMMC500]
MNRVEEAASDRSKAYGSDFLQLDVGEAPAGGMADWLAWQLREAIADGRLEVGGRLPPTRVLAAELRVSRGVVTEAYRRLTEDGHVEGRRRAGTVVVAAPVGAGDAAGPAARAGGAVGPAARAGGAVGPAARAGQAARAGGAADSARPGPGRPAVFFPTAPGPGAFDALRAAPARIDLTPGLPDLAAFPRAAWLRAERAVLAELSAADLGYGDPHGAPALRRAVAGWLARNRGIRADPDDVVVVAGTAQALTLLHPVLRADGMAAVALEDPGSLGTRQHLENGGLDVLPVPVDADGIRVEALRATGARAVLLTPAHQFPTGAVLSGERRRELLRWAEDGGGLVLEDDYDAEHRYDRPPVPALRAMLAERVCYMGSVSKLLAPALRVGWVVPPPGYRDALVNAKRFTDLGNAVLPQLVLARLMESGELERHLRLLRGRHRRRRDAMIAAVAEHLPGAVVHGAAAGLHLTVTFGGAGGAEPAGVTDTELAAAALSCGVKVQPLSWHRLRPGPPGLVLGYAASHPDAVTEGVRLLGQALRGT